MSGQIDRLIEFKDKVVIIDYKSTFKDCDEYNILTVVYTAVKNIQNTITAGIQKQTNRVLYFVDEICEVD